MEPLSIFILIGLVSWVVGAFVAAGYGAGKGYPGWPLLLVSLVLGPFGWIIAIAVVALKGPRPLLSK